MEFVDWTGLRVAYERAGACRPLVLVHGAGEDRRIWEPQMASLNSEVTVVAWDEPRAGGTVVLELYRRHPDHVATLIMIDTYAGWTGSLPEAEVEARVETTRQMFAAPPKCFDPTPPGRSADEPPAAYLQLLADPTAPLSHQRAAYGPRTTTDCGSSLTV